MQKIVSGRFASPFKHLSTDQNNSLDTKTNNCRPKNNSYVNHILAPLNNSNGKHHHAPSYLCSVGGGIDVVDHSNSLSPTSDTTTVLATSGNGGSGGEIAQAAAPAVVHTPSESNSETSPDATSSSSSSSSSSGEEWESGEWKSNFCSSSSCAGKPKTSLDHHQQLDVISDSQVDDSCKSSEHGEKEHLDSPLAEDFYADDNYYCGATQGTKILSQRKRFKAKAQAATDPVIERKMLWLANMQSDPDFRETLTKHVHFRSGSGSTDESVAVTQRICDKPWFGSPLGQPLFDPKSPESHESGAEVVFAKNRPISAGFEPKMFAPTPPQSPPPTPTVADRKSPSKTDFMRIFSFSRRESSHDKSPAPNGGPATTSAPVPIISVVDDDCSTCDIVTPPAVTQRLNRCTPFSLREIKLEIQSAFKNQTSSKLKEAKK